MHRSQLCFAYGSNMDPAQMRERCPESDLSWFVAEAREWKLCFPRCSKKRDGGVASIVPDPTGSQPVWGVVFSVTDRDLERLDRYEGVTSGKYRREPLEVLDQKGTRYKVWAYFAVVQDNPPKEYEPSQEYIELFIRGTEYFGLPNAYVDFLKSLKRKKTEKK